MVLGQRDPHGKGHSELIYLVCGHFEFYQSL